MDKEIFIVEDGTRRIEQTIYEPVDPLNPGSPDELHFKTFYLEFPTTGPMVIESGNIIYTWKKWAPYASIKARSHSARGM
jgi:hypothetical protein